MVFDRFVHLFSIERADYRFGYDYFYEFWYKYRLMELKGKTIIVTGATDGLGKLVATHLAQQGAKVLLHGRNREKGQMVLEELKKQTGNEQLEYYNGDFASMEAVRGLAAKIMKKHAHIDVLINNVGIGKGKKRELSQDGLEMHFAVNYLSHVVLTEELLSAFVKGTRIINVASVGQEAIDFDDLLLEKRYDGLVAYRKSKTALIMWTFDLAERLRNRGINVNAVHPASLMNTKMVAEDWGAAQSTVEEGAVAVENLVHTENTGQYYDRVKVGKAIPQAYDVAAREKLRSITRELSDLIGSIQDINLPGITDR